MRRGKRPFQWKCRGDEAKKLVWSFVAKRCSFKSAKPTYGFWWNLGTVSSAVKMPRTVRKWKRFYFQSCSKRSFKKRKSIPKGNKMSYFNPNKNIFSFVCQLKVKKHLVWVILKLISLPCTLPFQLLNQEVNLFCSSSSEYPEIHLLWLIQGLNPLKHVFEKLLHVILVSILCERTWDCYNILAG